MKLLLNLAIVLCVLTCWLAANMAHAETAKKGIRLKFRDQSLSATIKDARLRDVLEELKAKKGIEYSGNPALLESTISAEFSFLPMDEALKKLLAEMSYSLSFGDDRQVKGISVVGRATGVDRTGDGPKPPRHLGPPERVPKSGEVTDPSFTVIPNMPPPENPNAKPIDTTIVENSPPPENPDAPLIDMTVIPNSPPPGAPDTGMQPSGGPNVNMKPIQRKP